MKNEGTASIHAVPSLFVPRFRLRRARPGSSHRVQRPCMIVLDACARTSPGVPLAASVAVLALGCQPKGTELGEIERLNGEPGNVGRYMVAYYAALYAVARRGRGRHLDERGAARTGPSSFARPPRPAPVQSRDPSHARRHAAARSRSVSRCCRERATASSTRPGRRGSRRPATSSSIFRSSRDHGATWSEPQHAEYASPWRSRPRSRRDRSGGVYVAWPDERGYTTGIFVNRSLDRGATWMPQDVRIDRRRGRRPDGQRRLGCERRGERCRRGLGRAGGERRSRRHGRHVEGSRCDLVHADAGRRGQGARRSTRARASSFAGERAVVIVDGGRRRRQRLCRGVGRLVLGRRAHLGRGRAWSTSNPAAPHRPCSSSRTARTRGGGLRGEDARRERGDLLRRHAAGRHVDARQGRPHAAHAGGRQGERSRARQRARWHALSGLRRRAANRAAACARRTAARIGIRRSWWSIGPSPTPAVTVRFPAGRRRRRRRLRHVGGVGRGEERRSRTSGTRRPSVRRSICTSGASRSPDGRRTAMAAIPALLLFLVLHGVFFHDVALRGTLAVGRDADRGTDAARADRCARRSRSASRARRRGRGVGRRAEPVPRACRASRRASCRSGIPVPASARRSPRT